MSLYRGRAFLCMENKSRRAPADSQASASPEIVQLRIDGEIEPILAEYIVGGIEQANRDHASLILITMNTPGGLDTSMREIIQAILQSSVPVATFVTPSGSRAASAGFFILLSADVTAMSPEPIPAQLRPLWKSAGKLFRLTTR